MAHSHVARTQESEGRPISPAGPGSARVMLVLTSCVHIIDEKFSALSRPKSSLHPAVMKLQPQVRARQYDPLCWARRGRCRGRAR
jgi:hypothetical protein